MLDCLPAPGSGLRRGIVTCRRRRARAGGRWLGLPGAPSCASGHDRGIGLLRRDAKLESIRPRDQFDDYVLSGMKLRQVAQGNADPRYVNEEVAGLALDHSRYRLTGTQSGIGCERRTEHLQKSLVNKKQGRLEAAETRHRLSSSPCGGSR